MPGACRPSLRWSLLNVSAHIFKQRVSSVLNLLFIPLVAFILSLKLQEYFNINLVLIVAVPVYVLKNLLLDDPAPGFMRLNALDVSAYLVALVELVGYFTSTYRANSFYYLMEAFFLLLCYCLIRYNLRYEYQRLPLFFFMAAWAVFLSAVGFVNFYQLNARLRAAGFNDITNFRYSIYVLNPIGLAIGEWVTTLFLVLPFPLILFIRFRGSRLGRALFCLASTALLAVTLMTFIRGVYVAVAAFALAGSALFYLYGLFPLRRILQFNAAVALLTMATLVPVAKPALTTVSMLKTTSQVRSFEGRKSIWKNTLEIIKDHPLLGIGAYNFSMQYVVYKGQDEESGVAMRPFNYFLQLLVEKGLLGFLVYSLLTINFFRVSHRKVRLLGDNTYRKAVVILFMVAYAAVIVRDLSESSLFINRGAHTLLWFMFAHNAQPEDSEG